MIILMMLLSLLNTPVNSSDELDCLAKNIYYEAGIDDRKSKLAVAQITLNRRDSGKWGDSICEVVYSPYQFSWTLEDKPPPTGRLWEESQVVALQSLVYGKRIENLGASMDFHEKSIKPYWAKHYKRVTTIGSHIYYRR